MKKEDLKVGMTIYHYGKSERRAEVIFLSRDGALLRNDGYGDYFAHDEELAIYSQLKPEPKKVTYYRYYYQHRQSPRSTIYLTEYTRNVFNKVDAILIETETREFLIKDE
jgi:hypothetical protein